MQRAAGNGGDTPDGATGGDGGAMIVHPATALLREILDLTERFERHLGAELAVNPTDFDAMEELIRDGPLSPTDLARRLSLSTAAVTTVVDRLTTAGHVSRQPNPADRRGVLVVPAPESIGRALATLLPMIRGMDAVLGGFDETERATITAYLTRVAGVYRDRLPRDAAATAVDGPIPTGATPRPG